MRTHTRLTLISALAALSLGAVAFAEEPTAPANQAKEQADAARIDRDGKRICGYDMMTESERGGYRNLMHKSATLEDRNDIRADHCARMKARAKERGVPFEE
jgi:hypothetical protein